MENSNVNCRQMRSYIWLNIKEILWELDEGLLITMMMK